MKLNIGCGKVYKEGFVNIDAFDKSVADKIMDADNLDFLNDSVDEIYAGQLIEHLGIIKSIYTLSEWFRVLKPGGILTVETPFIEESFKRFLKGDRETKKVLINWIYGLDTEGMTHKFCFPEDLLEEVLNRAGFVDFKKTYYDFIDKTG